MACRSRSDDVARLSGAALEQEPRRQVAGERRDLAQRLELEVAELLGDKAGVIQDDPLFEMLITLHDCPVREVWSTVAGPWIAARQAKLRLVYAEHRALSDDTQLLAQPLAPLLLERLENDRARVVANWPYEINQLQALEDVWGVRMLLS